MDGREPLGRCSFFLDGEKDGGSCASQGQAEGSLISFAPRRKIGLGAPSDHSKTPKRWSFPCAAGHQ